MSENVDNVPSFMKDLVVRNKDANFNPFVVPDSHEPDVAKIKPEAGFCLKTKDKVGNKLFINFCHSTELPPPKDIDEEELSEILTNSTDEETINYRVPISLGEPKETLDKSEKPCNAHDVVINSDFFKKVEKSELFKNFVIHVAFEGLEDKYKIEIVKKGYTILKNRKYIGTMSDVTVRIAPPPPLITEISSTSTLSPKMEKKLPSDTDEKAKFGKFPPPEYKIIQDPPEGHPTHLVGEFRMPFLLKSSEIQLDLGEDRIVMCVPNKYFLDIFIPYLICQEESRAEFNIDTLVLTVTMPVLPKN